MKKLFLILCLGIVAASCGGSGTATPTEIVTETPAVEEVSQTETAEATETTETTYFDNVFQEDLDGFCGGHLYLTKDMKYFRIEDGRGGMQNITYGTYSINNNIIEIVSERSDISRKLEISKNGNEIWLIEINEEYPKKFKLVENDKELIEEFKSIFRSEITGSSQSSSANTNSSNENYSWMHGEWRISYSVNDPWVGILHVNAVLIIDTNNKTMTSIDPDRGIIDCSGKYTINKNNNTISADGMYVNFDSSRRQFYSKANGSIYYYNKVK